LICGLKRFAAFSGGMPPIDAERFYRDLEPPWHARSVPPTTHDRVRSRQYSRTARRIFAQTSAPLGQGHVALFRRQR